MSSGGDATEDLKWVLYILGGIFLVWLMTGGYARYQNEKGFFLKPPSPIDSGEVYGGAIGSPTYKGSFVAPSTFKVTNTKYFTVSLPSGWTMSEYPSNDGYYTGEFTNGTSILKFDYGSSPSPLPVDTTKYTIISEKVDGVNTKFVLPKKIGLGVTGAYYHRLFGKDLTIAGDNLSRSEMNQAFSIMRSVKFK
jgi:hypothetical protein